jgi:hypothetical protein
VAGPTEEEREKIAADFRAGVAAEREKYQVDSYFE